MSEGHTLKEPVNPRKTTMKIAAFPKCYIEAIAQHHTMTLFDWIDMAPALGAEGLELYDGFLQSAEPDYLREVHDKIHAAGCQMPMLCCSPDFTNPVVAGESFLAAVACDDARAEYLCFAESLKESHGATLDGWVLARESLREDLGSSLKHAHLLRPAPGELHRTLIWWEHEGKRHIGLQMERQPFFDILHQGSQKAGSFLSAPPSYFLNIEEDKLTLGLQDSVLRGLISSDVDGLVLGTEWKVAGFLFP